MKLSSNNLEVISSFFWIHYQNNMSEGGLVMQVTSCRIGNVEFYVRENINGVDSFMISSGERQGDKAGRKPSLKRNILEQSAPSAYWNEIASVVRKNDTLNRPVKRNRMFTRDWVYALIKEENLTRR